MNSMSAKEMNDLRLAELATEMAQPMDGMVDFAELMIDSASEIPEEEFSKWWGFFGKDSILTKSDGSRDNVSAANDFAIANIYEIMSRPAFEITVDYLKKQEQVRRRIMSQHKRSDEGFERQALTTQIKEIRSQHPTEESGGGFWSGLGRKLGFGGKKKELHADS